MEIIIFKRLTCFLLTTNQPPLLPVTSHFIATSSLQKVPFDLFLMQNYVSDIRFQPLDFFYFLYCCNKTSTKIYTDKTRCLQTKNGKFYFYRYSHQTAVCTIFDTFLFPFIYVFIVLSYLFIYFLDQSFYSSFCMFVCFWSIYYFFGLVYR